MPKTIVLDEEDSEEDRYTTIRLSSSSLQPSIISRVRYVLNHYWLGSKLLYRNWKSIQEIRQKDEKSLTRLDHLALQQFRYDIRVGLPFVALFALPIVGYAAPLLAILAPKYLPSTLVMPTQKVTFLKADANTSSTIIDSFLRFNQGQYNDQTVYGMLAFIQLINQLPDLSKSLSIISLLDFPIGLSLTILEVRFHLEGDRISKSRMRVAMKSTLEFCWKKQLKHRTMFHSSSSEVSRSEDRLKTILSLIPENSSLFASSYPLSSFSREHLLILHQSVLHSSFVARYFLSNYSLESQLEMWQYRTFIDDQRIQDVSKLSSFQLVSSLYNRGLYLHVNEMGEVFANEQSNRLNQSKDTIEINEKIINDWRNILTQWMTIHRKLSQSTSSTTSFLLHISPLLVQQ